MFGAFILLGFVWRTVFAAPSIATPVVAHKSAPHINAASQPIIIAYSYRAPNTKTAGGKLKGTFVDIASDLLVHASYEYTTQYSPIKRIMQQMKSGQAHVWVRVKAPDWLTEHMIRSRMPVKQLKLRLYSMGNPVLTSIWDVTEPIVAIHGYTYLGLRKKLLEASPALMFLDATNHDSGLKMLMSGRARYMLNYAMPVEMSAKKLGVATLHFRPVSDTSMYLYVSKKAPNAERLMRDLEDSFEILHPVQQQAKLAK